MKYLEWDTQITRVVTKQSHNLKATKLSGITGFFYRGLVLCSWISRVLFVAVMLGIPVLWILDANKKSPVIRYLVRRRRSNSRGAMSRFWTNCNRWFKPSHERERV